MYEYKALTLITGLDLCHLRCMSDRFAVNVNPALEIPTEQLATFAESLRDLRPFWSRLGEHLSDETQSRWPLRRQSGQLRQSLTWTGQRLGRGGIYKATSDSLVVGSRIFYSGFSQYGTRHQPARKLIHVDPSDVTARLETWARERAIESGLTVL